jgi:hypothetical protein
MESIKAILLRSPTNTLRVSEWIYCAIGSSITTAILWEGIMELVKSQRDGNPYIRNKNTFPLR